MIEYLLCTIRDFGDPSLIDISLDDWRKLVLGEGWFGQVDDDGFASPPESPEFSTAPARIY